MVNFKPVVLFLKTIQGKRGANFFSYNFQNFNSDFHLPKKNFCNTYIFQYFMKQRKTNIGIWSFNRI